MASSMASSTEVDLTQVIHLLVDGIAQEIGADRRDMRVTFVAESMQIIGSTTFQLGKNSRNNLMEETKFVW